MFFLFFRKEVNKRKFSNLISESNYKLQAITPKLIYILSLAFALLIHNKQIFTIHLILVFESNYKIYREQSQEVVRLFIKEIPYMLMYIKIYRVKLINSPGTSLSSKKKKRPV